jgi:hypothetical protein
MGLGNMTNSVKTAAALLAGLLPMAAYTNATTRVTFAAPDEAMLEDDSAAGQFRFAPLLQTVPEPRPWGLVPIGLGLLLVITRKLNR